MASQVWGRNPQEAYEEPYEYGVQEQFSREATSLLSHLYRGLNSERHRFSVDDRSPEKAIWLLAMDALDSLRDSLSALSRKDHRVAAKLFRDATETMDLAAYFHSGRQRSRTSVEKWYRDEIVSHSEYRDHIKSIEGAEAAEKLRNHYRSLSRFTHRSYRALLDGYSLGGGDRLIHDRTAELFGKAEGAASTLVLPQTIASYYAVLANLVLVFSSELSKRGLLTQEEVRSAYADSLEAETIPRRFLPRRWLAARLNASTLGTPRHEEEDGAGVKEAGR